MHACVDVFIQVVVILIKFWCRFLLLSEKLVLERPLKFRSTFMKLDTPSAERSVLYCVFDGRFYWKFFLVMILLNFQSLLKAYQ